MPLIWVVEDDISIGPGLVRTLEAEGHAVAWARTITEAGTFEGAPELVLLDLALPDGDGLDLCTQLIGRHPDVRIIILTARASEVDVVLGLDSGAVDYVTKPFRLAELLARVRAQLRGRGAVPEPGGSTIGVGDLVIDPAARKLWLGGREIELRAKEFDLILRLAQEPGAVVRREVLMADVWDEHWFGTTKTLDVHMAALRRHLGEAPGEPSRITTVRGVGYRLELPS
jgi:DNA-binding response OmpR family regulator